jgi:hypothetical protein
MDLLWYALEHDVEAAEVAPVMGLTEAQVLRGFEDIKRKIRTTEFLRLNPPMLEPAETLEHEYAH